MAMRTVPRVNPGLSRRRKVLVAVPNSTIGHMKLGGIFRYAAEHADWSVEIVANGNLLTPEMLRTAMEGGMDGLMVEGRPGIDPAVEEAVRAGLPVALFDSMSFPAEVGGVLVNTDDAAIGLEAAAYLIRDVHRMSFGFVHSRIPSVWSGLRGKAFGNAIRRRRAAFFEFRSSPDGDASDGALAGWLRSLPKPAAVFAADNYRAYDVLGRCKEMGLRVPKDVAVMGTGVSDVICENVAPSLTSIEPDYSLQGYLAAERLDRLMALLRPAKVARTLCAIRRIMVRESAPDCNQRAGLLVQKAMAFIADHAAESIGPRDVAAHLRVSRSLIDLRFREVAGKSILEVINERRLSLTRQALINSSDPIALVCIRCGWKSENHPKRLFRERYGMTMRDFRRRKG